MAITVISVDISFAARSPRYKSRTMARAMTTLALAPSACSTRQAIKVPDDPAMAQPAEPIRNSTSPAATGERRPYRSDSGPQASWPRQNPIR